MPFGVNDGNVITAGSERVQTGSRQSAHSRLLAEARNYMGYSFCAKQLLIIMSLILGGVIAWRVIY